jgi:carbamoyl-phosphate synthase small subunit
MKAFLVLEDGTVFEGKGFGAIGTQHGEVVFNTSMTGYQEILTDPSYCGQIITMTYPLIGNYGVNSEDFESGRSFARGFVVREWSDHPSNWRNEKPINEFLKEQGIIGISNIDTRALTRKIRNHGVMRGVITTEEHDTQKLIKLAQEAPKISGQELVPEVTTKEVYHEIPQDGADYKVVMMDFGGKRNIIRSLQNYGCEVIVVPAQTNAEEILSYNPDGIMLSNGPGDPVDVPYAIDTVRDLIGKKPIFGICLGHQIVGLALGAQTYKLSFGHRGGNHPVKDLKSGRVHITSQNHGYVIDEESLKTIDVEVSHINLNDGTIEGIRHKSLPLFSVQYHPEASPGPTDSEYLFEEFISLMKREGK